MNALIALGLGIIIFALIVGVGVVIIQNFSGTVGDCASGYTFNYSRGLCSNGTTAFDTAPTGTASTTLQTINGYLSSNLVTWVPAIIALGVGLLFIGALMGRKNQTY